MAEVTRGSLANLSSAKVSHPVGLERLESWRLSARTGCPSCDWGNKDGPPHPQSPWPAHL